MGRPGSISPPQPLALTGHHNRNQHNQHFGQNSHQIRVKSPKSPPTALGSSPLEKLQSLKTSSINFTNGNSNTGMIGDQNNSKDSSSTATTPTPSIEQSGKEVSLEEKAKQPVLWPAWVYCTRYSDRPSSGKQIFFKSKYLDSFFFFFV
ncbi:homeobox protein [Dermatophagoides pteronyssinus]|uniref:Homeobox protein n=1 Tax=Dermatophagoides pteronyssinus TaxID=6956 RepID=A0ABQ8JE35_DERPT|nr:homeobox protein [Dermatophagoides pteronyssinus]